MTLIIMLDVMDRHLVLNDEKEEELQSTIGEILKVIKGEEENEKLIGVPKEILFKDICQKIGWDYDRKTAQKIGYIFKKNLFLKTKRKTKGTVLLLNDPKNKRKLKYLFKMYKV